MYLKLQSSADLMHDFISNNMIEIITISIGWLVLYYYCRNKIKIIYLLDFIMVSSFILIIYIVLAPHRYWGIIDFIILTFR